MADSLPLIPEKSGAQCGDVRRVLREILRHAPAPPTLLAPEPLPQKYDEQDRSELAAREAELRRQYARRQARPLPRNKYHLLPPGAPPRPDAALCRNERMFIQRRDLFPAIQQNAGREESLWVRNTLRDGSSSRLACRSDLQPRRSLASPGVLPLPPAYSDLSLSIGVPRYPPSPLALSTPTESLPPEYLICIPSEIEFVNFTVGETYSRDVAVVNVSCVEVAVSVGVPARTALHVSLHGTCALRVAPGQQTALRVTFVPRDVRALSDELRLRVSRGRALAVPIRCYMQPPILYVSVPMDAGEAQHRQAAAPGTGGVVELGARLVGAVHEAALELRCAARHAQFFVLGEEAWARGAAAAITRCGALRAGAFTLRPAWWRGGGALRAAATCRARGPGLQAEALRLLSDTAVVRPLTLLADALYFRPDHITIEAQEKDYDICSEDDPDSEYYLHLGTAFPNGSASKTIRLINHSPVTYTYYWQQRAWGECSCLRETLRSVEPDPGALSVDELATDAVAPDPSTLCVGAREALAREDPGESAATSRVSVTSRCGAVAARGAADLRVRVSRAACSREPRRAVLMLILTNIPKESFPPDYDPMIVKTETIQGEEIPGEESWTREVCSVVGCQLEVWWDVAPLRFVLDPPAVYLPHSRRVTSALVCMRATQTSGPEAVELQWSALPALPAPLVPPGAVPLRSSSPGVVVSGAVPPAPHLHPEYSVPVTLQLSLPILPSSCHPVTDIIELQSLAHGARSTCLVWGHSARRAAGPRPARTWLHTAPPHATLRVPLTLRNDTKLPFRWRAAGVRVCGAVLEAKDACARAQCPACRQRACACRLLAPRAGPLPSAATATILYEDRAPDADGCVATLIRVSHSSDDEDEEDEAGEGPPGAVGGWGRCRAGVEGRAALVAYRVLAPRLLLRVMPCYGDKLHECTCCCVDAGGGGAVLRPARALAAGRRACYRLRVRNLTPMPTRLRWLPAPHPRADSEDPLKVIFCPNDFDVGSYADVEIKVVLEARAVAARRVVSRRARAEHARHYLHLLIDAAVSGLEVVCEIPIGGAEKTDAFINVRRSQREVLPGEQPPPVLTEPADVFAEEDRKRAKIQENICRCQFELKYIPPHKLPRAPPTCSEEYLPIEIVTEPPALTRVCACYRCRKPMLPDEPHPCCIQFWALPLRTVSSRRLTLRNVSQLTARWRVLVRHHPRVRCSHIHKDAWAMGVGASGVALQASPARGVLAGGAAAGLTLRVYADCWGVYHDQLLILIDHLEPIVVDVWVEAVGSPLQLALAPDVSKRGEESPTMWMTPSDPVRKVRVRNVSRADLSVHAYMLRDHDVDVTPLPFRLYLRMFDIPPNYCPCVSALNSSSCPGEEDTVSVSTEQLEPGTGVGLFLTADLGVQDDSYFKMPPDAMTLAAGGAAEWYVDMSPRENEHVPPHTLLLRPLPTLNKGTWWWRPEPAPTQVQVVRVCVSGMLRAAPSHLAVRLCALDLPYGDVLRVRKRFRVQNIGSGQLSVRAHAAPPWRVTRGGRGGRCGAGCGGARGEGAAQGDDLVLCLQPRSSIEMCAEVSVSAASVWPACAQYAPRLTEVTPLHFYDDTTVLQTMSLTLELEYPVLAVEPRALELGFVCDGDTRKAYVSVSHSSRTDTLQLRAQWRGDAQFEVWPPRLRLAPGHAERVYVQYTAKWCVAPAEGWIDVYALCGAGAGVSPGPSDGPFPGSEAEGLVSTGGWCRARVSVRALPSRDHRCHLPTHDYTDDPHLLPPNLPFIK